MSIKNGDKVVVVASSEDLRLHACDKSIVTGGVYEIYGLYAEGGYLKGCGECDHVMIYFVEKYEDYSDDDWV